MIIPRGGHFKLLDLRHRSQLPSIGAAQQLCVRHRTLSGCALAPVILQNRWVTLSCKATSTLGTSSTAVGHNRCNRVLCTIMPKLRARQTAG
jgi:hypothetical protein